MTMIRKYFWLLTSYLLFLQVFSPFFCCHRRTELARETQWDAKSGSLPPTFFSGSNVSTVFIFAGTISKVDFITRISLQFSVQEKRGTIVRAKLTPWIMPRFSSDKTTRKLVVRDRFLILKNRRSYSLEPMNLHENSMKRLLVKKTLKIEEKYMLKNKAEGIKYKCLKYLNGTNTKIRKNHSWIFSTLIYINMICLCY